MAIKTRSELKQLFTTGAKPTQQNFADWLDSYKHVADLQQPSLATAPTPVNGDLWYNTATSQFQGTRNGTAQNFLMGNDAILNQSATEQAADAKISGGFTGAGFYTNGWWYQGLYLTNFGHIYGITDQVVYDTVPGIGQSFRIGGAPVMGIDWKGITINGRLLLSETASDIIPGEPLSGGIYYNSAVQRFRGRINGVYQNFVMGTEAQVRTGHVIVVDADAPQATDTRTDAGTYNASIPFKTITAAVAASVQGNTIVVMPGVYTENITLTQTQNAIRIILSGATLNGDIVNNGLPDGFYASLQYGATVNGVIGQYSNYSGFCEIDGDGTGTIITNNRTLFSNNMRVSGLKLLNSGTAICAAGYQGNVQVKNCKRIIGGLASYMKNIDNINTTSYTGGYSGIVQLIDIARVGNMNCPINGFECYIKATNCYFLSTVETTFSNIFGEQTYFKNCRFSHPSGLTGFINNTNGSYVFENCSFYFVTPPAYAISATPNTGTLFMLVNCVSNAGDIMQGTAPSVIKVNCSSIPAYMLPDY